MSGDKVLDTNILIYLFDGDKHLARLLHGQRLFVSAISELELLSYHGLTENDRKLLRGFLSQCTIVELSQPIKELCISIRAAHKLKLPDAIVVATAAYLGKPLMTADKDLSRVTDINTVIYEP